MPGSHALLSASGSSRWLNCPPSARLESLYPEQTSIYASEGTWAHELAEYKVKRYLHRRMKRPQSEEFDTDEVEHFTDVYLEYAQEIIEKMRRNGCEPLVLIEEKLDLSTYVPESFGTCDLLILGKDEDGKGLLCINDYKNGSIPVDGDHNTQMMLYALGALNGYGFLQDVENVQMTIIQPRLGSISSCRMTVSELLSWGESIKPIAVAAFNGGGGYPQKPGPWCRFCKAKAQCEACRQEAMSLVNDDFVDVDEEALGSAGEGVVGSPSSPSSSSLPFPATGDKTAEVEKSDTPPVFKMPGLIPLEELEKILPTLDRIQDWIDSVFAYVSGEAIQHGVPIAGYKVVEGRSKRAFTDPKAVAAAAEAAGYTDIYKQSLLTITEFEKMMGKKKFQEVLGDLVAKPPGKLTLVPDSDPRPTVDTSSPASAADDFDEV